MTAPRPVEPVVGMEYDGLPLGLFQRCRIVAMTLRTVTYQPSDEDALTLTVARADFMRWWPRCAPVLWTVGPSEQPYTRLCHDDERGEYRDVFWMHTPCKCREGCRRYVALWPTRAAAIAAGKAFGWSEPVARRVVRK